MDSFPLQVLGDATRRRLVDELRSGERPVGDLVGPVGIAQSGISRHLRILSDAGFVQVRADGQRRLYSLRPEPFQQIDAWMEGYRVLWEGQLDRLGRALDQHQPVTESRTA